MTAAPFASGNLQFLPPPDALPYPAPDYAGRGPPGLIGHIIGMIEGELWDRIGADGPRFEVAEVHRNRLRRALLQAGRRDYDELPEIPIAQGLIVDEPLFSVRTATLDHCPPVQAYAFESKAKFNVDNKLLKTLGLLPAPG